MKLLEPAMAVETSQEQDEPAFNVSWTRESDKNKARGYHPGNDLIDAINVALLLNQPLLLTGEPGTGKTQLAFYVSWKLELDPPLIFETKSTSTSRDLFYTYDTLGRFYAAQLHNKGSVSDEQAVNNARDFITYNALGLAILRANEEKSVGTWLPTGSNIFSSGEQKRSVVVIDEIDKAPRDFPNDLLNEIEYMYFRVPELGIIGGEKIDAPESLRPVLILTSNSEKHLPDAFLRRCAYHHIPFPDDIALEKIVTSRMGQMRGMDGWLSDALNLFWEIRKLDTRLDKKPATAELLSWLMALQQNLQLKGVSAPLSTEREILWSTLNTTLLKSTKDKELGKTVLEKWLTSH